PLISGVRFRDIYISGNINKRLLGKNIEAIAKERKLNGNEAIFEVIIEDPGTRMVFFAIQETDLINFMKYERVCIGTDGRAFKTTGEHGEGKPHPRSFGTFPRIINEYVRIKRILALEEAVYKMTYLPSLILNLQDRGCLDEGKKADITVFDFKKVRDTSTFEVPFAYPEGIEFVIVNGRIALYNKQIKGYYGRVLKKTVGK
ncbi:MAG: amidohydrolase family protein, partial [Candidatus Firestonebacteria bacterium]